MVPSDGVSSNMLIGWITFKDDNGGVIYTNTGKTEKSNGFQGDNFQSGTNFYRLDFIGAATMIRVRLFFLSIQTEQSG